MDEINLNASGWNDLLNLFLLIGPFIYFMLIWLSIPFQIEDKNDYKTILEQAKIDVMEDEK